MRVEKTILAGGIAPESLLGVRADLEERGWRLVLVQDGADILCRCESNPPDLVIVGDGLRDMDGSVCCAYLRDIPESSNVVIVWLAGGEEAHCLAGRRMAEFVGADYCLSKPLEPAALLELIARLLVNQRPVRTSRSAEFPTRVVWPTHQSFASSRS